MVSHVEFARSPLPQAGEGVGVRGLLGLSWLIHPPHPQPFSRLREKGVHAEYFADAITETYIFSVTDH